MKTTIRKKLLISIISLLTLLYIITGAATGVYVRSLLVERADRDNRQVLLQAMQQLDVILQMGDMTARQVMTDADIEGIVRAAQAPQSQQYIVLSRANELLTRYIALNPFVANIVIFTPDDLTLSNQGVLLGDHFRSREQSAWFSAFTDGAGRMTISEEYGTMAQGNAQNVVTIAYKYRMLSQQSRLDNYLMIDIPSGTFRDLLRIKGAYRGVLVVNDAGQTIVSSDLLSAENLSGNNNYDGIYYLKDTIALHERMESVGWNLYYPIPRSEFNRPITMLLAGFAGLYALVLLTSIALLSRRIHNVVDPVHRITSTMQAAYNGNLDVCADEHSGDEFEILSDCFNKLVDDLKRHIAKILEEENAKNEMQMDLMMSQIHPHFIYNTLHSAVYLIEEGEGVVAIDTIYALINILQSTVRIGSKEIFATVGEELALARSYAEIAAVRYPGMFRLTVECEERLLRESIPKVLIQPLVENSITHGILPSGRRGDIRITIVAGHPGCIDIHVVDDGVGISLEEVNEVWRGGRRKSAHGVGLHNIRNRIQCLYNAVEHAFEIGPRLGGGTDAYIRLAVDGAPESAEPQSGETSMESEQNI